MPVAFCAASSSRKPLVRSSVTLTPVAPSRISRLALPPVALIMASAARLPCWTKSEPSCGPTSLQAVTPVMLRSTGIIATCLLLAYAMASPRPVELIGEKMMAFAPLSIMPLMSVFSCCTFDCALVVRSLMPRFFASSTCDLVDWMRKGLASFSDWAQPMVAVFRSIFGMPRSDPLQIGPYCASTPAGLAVVSRVVPPAALMAAGTPPAAPEAGAPEAAELAGAELAGAELAGAELLPAELAGAELLVPPPADELLPPQAAMDRA